MIRATRSDRIGDALDQPERQIIVSNLQVGEAENADVTTPAEIVGRSIPLHNDLIIRSKCIKQSRETLGADVLGSDCSPICVRCLAPKGVVENRKLPPINFRRPTAARAFNLNLAVQLIPPIFDSFEDYRGYK